MRRFTRRSVLAGGAGISLASGLMGRLALAGEKSDRQFLFIFCQGGWDPTYLFADKSGSSTIDTQSGAGVATSGDLSWVAHADRPSVDNFFSRWGDRCAIINGMEVRSITHERCRRLLLTGRVDSGTDDWGSTLAHDSGALLPYLVTSGPAFTSAYTADVVRLGPAGQLVELLDGTALARSDAGLVAPSSSVQDLEMAYSAARVERFAAQAGAGFESSWADSYVQAVQQLDAVSAEGVVELDVTTSGYVTVYLRVQPALACLASGLSRCAMVQHDGLWDVGWDTHSEINAQSEHFGDLFGNLDDIVTDLSSRMSSSGGNLLDKTTVVVVSEMGRSPGVNGTGGKDHWTYTSAMLIGAGVNGGRVVGGFDDDLLGETVDFESGEITDKGNALTSGVLGATLLAMGDRDPGETEPLWAVMA